MNDETASYDAHKPRWYHRTWLITPLTGVIALAIGYAVATTTQDVRSTQEYRAVAADRDAATEALGQAQQSMDETEQSLDQAIVEKAQLQLDKQELEGDIPERQAAVNKAEAAVKERERKVAARERAVLKREKAVGIVERQIARNTVSDGIYEVGVDIKAGTYKTKGGGTCYWETRNTADGDLTNNSLTAGPSIVTVDNGEFVEFSCDGAEWVLQR